MGASLVQNEMFAQNTPKIRCWNINWQTPEIKIVSEKIQIPNTVGLGIE